MTDHHDKQAASSESPDTVIWGVHPILEMLKTTPRLIEEIVVRKGRTGRAVQEIIELSRQEAVHLRFDSSPAQDTGGRKSAQQGLWARVIPKENISLDDLLVKSAAAADTAPPLLVALDNIQDPQNLGAIIRVAAAAGCTGIILPWNRSAPVSGAVVKAAAGGLAYVDICRVTNLVDSLATLKENGFWIFGTGKEGGSSLYETDFSGPVCVVIGSEGKGIRPLVRSQCDFLVTIPMYSAIDSLNAATATAVMLFEIRRQTTGR